MKKSIRGLLIKDWMIGKRGIFVSLAFVFANFVLGTLIVLSTSCGNLQNIRGSVGIIVGVFSFIAGLFSFEGIYDKDTEADFPKISCSLPITDRERIAEKYILLLAGTVITFTINVLGIFILCSFGDVSFVQSGLKPFLLSMGLRTILTSVEIPVFYRFGTRYRMPMDIGCIILATVLIAMNLDKISSFEDMSKIISSVMDCGFVVFCFGILIAIPVSAFLSYKILTARRNVIW